VPSSNSNGMASPIGVFRPADLMKSAGHAHRSRCGSRSPRVQSATSPAFQRSKYHPTLTNGPCRFT
jgi:hypothetical protein